MKRHIIRENPSLLILVDFPGFNLKLAKFAKANGLPVIYFILLKFGHGENHEFTKSVTVSVKCSASCPLKKAL